LISFSLIRSSGWQGANPCPGIAPFKVHNPRQTMDHTDLTAVLHANLKEYMKNDDLDGFISDMALLLECNINDMEDCVETLSDNVVDMILTA